MFRTSKMSVYKVAMYIFQKTSRRSGQNNIESDFYRSSLSNIH